MGGYKEAAQRWGLRRVGVLTMTSSSVLSGEVERLVRIAEA